MTRHLLQQNLSLSLRSNSLCLLPKPTETLATQALCSRVGNLLPKSLPLSSKNKLVFNFSGNQQIHFVDKTMEGILFSLFFQDTFGRRLRATKFATFAFLLPLHRVDVSDVAQSWSAKLQQRVSAEEDEQQPLSVHLWAKKRCTLSNSIVVLKTTTPLGITACVSDDNCCKLQNAQSWSTVVKAMTLLLSFKQWEFSVSGETGNSLFSKDIYRAYLVKHSDFVLVSSSLAIQFTSSTIG